MGIPEFQFPMEYQNPKSIAGVAMGCGAFVLAAEVLVQLDAGLARRCALWATVAAAARRREARMPHLHTCRLQLLVPGTVVRLNLDKIPTARDL
jgi:hypothetical protein